MKFFDFLNKKLLIIVIFLVIFSFLPIVGIFSIKMPIYGQVVDSVSKKPIPNMNVWAQEKFLHNIHFETEWANAKFSKDVLDEKIKEVNDLMNILE